MSRNKLGQFEPGTCGNPRGRPRKIPLKISQDIRQRNFFEAGDTMVPIIEDGKRKLIPARIAIDKQLTLKAAAGDMRAIAIWKAMDQKHTLEYENTQIERALRVLKSEEIIRKFPEDVTDEYKALTRNLRSSLDPDYLP